MSRVFDLVRRMYTREGRQLQKFFTRRGVILSTISLVQLSFSNVRFAMGLHKFLISFVFLVLTATVASAYTVVLRDGRRVEIPNEFTVSGSTLTYQVGSGMQITLQLNTVDIAATERANGEAPGSFLRKANAPRAVEPAAQQPRRAGRSITNADLEKHRRARVDSEKEYEARRQELGLPSLEERRQEAAAITDRTVEYVRSMRAQEEAIWRSRAEALRAEAAANQARFGHQQPGEIPWSFSSLGGFPEFFPFDDVGFGIRDGRFGRFGRFRRFPSSPFDGFLATPITRFPTFPFEPAFRGRHGGRFVFRAPGVRVNPRPSHGRRGSRR
jgi:hypothetical protein